MQRVAAVERVTKGVGGGQPDRVSPDQRCVQQQDCEQCADGVADVMRQTRRDRAGVGEIAKVPGAGESGRRRGHQRDRTDHDHDDADPQIRTRIADPAWGDVLVDHVGLLEEQLPRGHRRAHDRHDQQQQRRVQPTGKLRLQTAVISRTGGGPATPAESPGR